MIGVDTNVLVRFLVADDERQFEKARRLIRHEAAAGDPVLINQLARLECEWGAPQPLRLSQGSDPRCVALRRRTLALYVPDVAAFAGLVGELVAARLAGLARVARYAAAMMISTRFIADPLGNAPRLSPCMKPR